jgi:NAD(P)-dependent dehydrogenase (short-subunit alcohol dehydrogenase family)
MSAVGAPEPALQGQTVLVIGGSSGIGFETARRARAQGAELILTARDPQRLAAAASQISPESTSAFDAHDPAALDAFFDALPGPVDQVMVTAGHPHYGRLADLDLEQARQAIGASAMLMIGIARRAVDTVRPGGTIIFMSGTGARRPGIGLSVISAVTAALPALTANLALEIAPVRVNLIAAGFVDTALSAELLGEQLDARREELSKTLPIRRVVRADDVAALAVHLMANTAMTGATYDIDGGQQLLPR